MDKHIIDKLVNFGLITNVGVDASKYKDVDDLINKGIITIPGAKAKIAELLNMEMETLVVEEVEEEVVVPVTKLEVEPTPPVAEHTPTPVVNDTVDTAETTEPTEPVVDNTIETEIVVEETVEDNKKKSKKA